MKTTIHLSLPKWVMVLRHCTKRCTLRQMPVHHRAMAKWIGTALPTVAAAWLAQGQEGWIFMWAMAAGLFFGAKWLTCFPILTGERRPARWRTVSYFLFWPGLDARAFCFGENRERPSTSEWAAAIAKMAAGYALVLWARGRADSGNEILTGWVAMVGIVFTLHFGFFALLSAFWRAAGVMAHPLMRLPVRATSLAGFWGGRWNSAFTDLMQRHFLPPLARRFGPGKAALGVFAISGILHECVISVPAGAGFGLPTAYFLLQGIALAVERSGAGRRVGLGRGFRGWVFVVLVAALPAGILFPPPFIHNVIIPMLKAL